MSDQATTVTATRVDGGVVLTVYPIVGDAVRVELTARRAALLGLDLLSLALEPVFRLGAESEPAGRGAQPVNPAGARNTGL